MIVLATRSLLTRFWPQDVLLALILYSTVVVYISMLTVTTWYLLACLSFLAESVTIWTFLIPQSTLL